MFNFLQLHGISYFSDIRVLIWSLYNNHCCHALFLQPSWGKFVTLHVASLHSFQYVLTPSFGYSYSATPQKPQTCRRGPVRMLAILVVAASSFCWVYTLMHRKLYTHDQTTVHVADLLSPCQAATKCLSVGHASPQSDAACIATLTPLLYTRHSSLKNFSRIVKLIVSPLHTLPHPSYKTGGPYKTFQL